MDWKTISISEDSQLERVIGFYQLIDQRIPSTKLRIKIIESAEGGGYMARPNLCWKLDGDADWICGWGLTEEEALQDLLQWFLSELDKRGTLSESDVIWAESSDF